MSDGGYESLAREVAELRAFQAAAVDAFHALDTMVDAAVLQGSLISGASDGWAAALVRVRESGIDRPQRAAGSLVKLPVIRDNVVEVDRPSRARRKKPERSG